MHTLSDLGDTLNQIDIMAARAKICQGELSEDYFQFDDSIFIVCCHTEAGAKNDIVGDYLLKIRAEIRAVQQALKQISIQENRQGLGKVKQKTPKERQLLRGKQI